MASPAARVLHPSSAADAPAPVAALFGKAGRSPRVYGGRDVEALLQLMQITAQKKLGVTLAGTRGQALNPAWLTFPRRASGACARVLP